MNEQGSGKPVLLLDIDGVLNAMSHKPPTHAWPKEVWKSGSVRAADGVNYPMLWSEPVITWLTNLHTSGAVEIRWHTTWQHDALNVGELMGLPEFGVQEAPEYEQATVNGSALAAKLIAACMPGWWKYPAAERVVTEEKRRLIWIDDDIDYQVSHSARQALKSVHRLLLVCPSQQTGIMAKHMIKVEASILNWKENPSGALSSS